MSKLDIEAGKRLKLARKMIKDPDTGKSFTQAQFGKEIGVSREFVSKLENGENELTIYILYAINDAFGISKEWLMEGIGDMIEIAQAHSATHKHTATEALASTISEPSEFYTPEIKVWGKTGAGMRFDYNMQETDPENLQPWKTIQVSGIVGSKYLDAFQVEGDSMEPAILNGAYIGVNFEDKHLKTGRIFVFNYPHEGLVVKRVQVKRDTVKIFSYNDEYDPEEFPSDIVDEHMVVGRVMWVHQKLDKR